MGARAAWLASRSAAVSQLDPAIDRLDDGAEPLLVGDDRHDAGLDLTLQLIDPVGRAPGRDDARERPRPFGLPARRIARRYIAITSDGY